MVFMVHTLEHPRTGRLVDVYKLIGNVTGEMLYENLQDATICGASGPS
jgi:hypothetical protein